MVVAVWVAQALPILINGSGGSGHDISAYSEITRYIISENPISTAHADSQPRLGAPHGEFPRGFPLMMASLRLAGISEVHAGRTVEAVSTIVFIIFLVGILLEFFPRPESFLIAACVVSMRSFIYYSANCLSELPYMAVATLSTFLLIKWRPYEGSWVWLGIAGLVAGASWGVRFIGISFMAAEALFLCLYFFWIPSKGTLRHLSVWGAGACVGAFPFAAWNLIEFGRVIPYGDFMHSGPGVSLWLNIQLLCFNILREFTTCESSNLLRWLLVILVAALILCMVVRPPFRTLSGWKGFRAFFADHRFALFLWVYLVLYTAMLFASQMRYKYTEWIDQRLLMPIFWIIWIGLVWAALRGLTHMNLRPRAARTVVIILLVGEFLMQTWFTFSAQTKPWLGGTWW